MTTLLVRSMMVRWCDGATTVSRPRRYVAMPTVIYDTTLVSLLICAVMSSTINQRVKCLQFYFVALQPPVALSYSPIRHFCHHSTGLYLLFRHDRIFILRVHERYHGRDRAEHALLQGFFHQFQSFVEHVHVVDVGNHCHENKLVGNLIQHRSHQ